MITACQNGDLSLVKELLKTEDPSIQNNCPFRMACDNGRDEIVELLLQDSRVSPDAGASVGLRNACELGHVKVVRLLLLNDFRSDPSAVENLAIQMAAKNNHIDIVRLLLEDPRVDVSDHDNLALILAFENHHMNIVRLILNDRWFEWRTMSECIKNHIIKKMEMYKN